MYGLPFASVRDAGKVIGATALRGVIAEFQRKPAQKIENPSGLMLTMLAQAVADPERRDAFRALGERAGLDAPAPQRTPKQHADALLAQWNDDQVRAFIASLGIRVPLATPKVIEREGIRSPWVVSMLTPFLIEKGLCS